MKRKLFIVEDELPLLKVLEFQFQKADFSVDIALDGLEALEKIKHDKPDLILLDIWLPKMNGFKFLEIIKKDDEFKHIPVVIFSNLSQNSDIEKGLALGALEYIDKSSITIQDLVKKIQGYLH